MNLRGRLRGWLRKPRRSQSDHTELREFVYLDDTSVHSLYASQLGEIVAERTDTNASKVRSELTSSVGANVHLAKAEFGSKLQAESSEGTQVMRKAIIQTTFRELRDFELQSLALGPLRNFPPPPKSVEDLMRAPTGLLIDPASLSRGALVELEVQLEAEPLFRAWTVFSSLLEILQENPTMFANQNVPELRTIQRMMEKLLSGLVPVRGRAVDYSVVVIEGKEWIIHRLALEHIEWGPTPKVEFPLYLVGVAEQSLFWKDIRRVLFAESSYRVFARIARAGVNNSWTPVKLVDVVRTFLPDFESVVETLNHGLIPGIQAASPSTEGATHRVRDALAAFAVLLADHVDRELVAEDVEAFCLTVQESDQFMTVPEQRKRFLQVQKFVESTLGVTIDRVTAAQYRTEAMIAAGFDLGGGRIPQRVRPAARDERLLDTEIVAIYW